MFNKKINKTIKLLITSHFILSGAWGLISPIFAIFLIQNVEQNPIETARIAGFASLIYWVLKSVLQIPISYYLDENHGEKDDFYFLIFGIFLTSLIPFGYAFSFSPLHIYILHALEAFGHSMMVPSRSAMFTRHIDKGQEAYEWAINSTCLGFASGITGALGGIIASQYGFRIVFFLVGFFSFFSGFAVFFIKDKVFFSNKKVTRVSQFIEENDIY